MKQIIKGAVLGGVIGIAAPIALSVINEFEGSQRSGGTKQARICFANRLWNLETFEIKHAPGCKNGILESTPTILLISVLSGSLIGALSLIKSNTQADERKSKTPSITPIESPNKDPLPSQEIAKVPLREAKTPTPTTQSSSPATESIPSPSNLQEKTPTISVGTNDSQSSQIPKGLTIPSASLPVALGLLLAGVGVIAAYQSGSNNNTNQQDSNEIPNPEPARSTPSADEWDDKSFTSETLEKLCKNAIFFNSAGDRGYGWMKYTLQGRMAAGNMTLGDYNRARAWFGTNCPDGW